ncbi:hypothetical protein SeLEV6574_g02132 [Synchytrium endobioticum]|uniref:Uncharacterized protein n=1 Tax=Synchytrium endobioticum TaxID=286115 RepID=A0A507D9G3_9FUNG|nr:hypothetical protein SeLEV6574_g02132 [Synchytrium endobioticum]
MVNPLSTSVEDIPIDHTPIRITTAPPSKAFSGDSIEFEVWHREIVNKAAINGLVSVIKGVKPENWTQVKWEDANIQYLGFIKLAVSHEI